MRVSVGVELWAEDEDEIMAVDDGGEENES